VDSFYRENSQCRRTVQIQGILVNHSKPHPPQPPHHPPSPTIQKLSQTLFNQKAMEISSLTLSFSSNSRIPLPSLPFSSSNSSFLSSIATTASLKKTKPKSNTLVVTRIRTRTEPAKKGLTCNALFGLGVPEVAVIAGVVALVFGPKKLPEVGKSIGKTLKSFQQVCKFSFVFSFS
jgi:sec-independent protein translocase protein TatA